MGCAFNLAQKTSLKTDSCSNNSARRRAFFVPAARRDGIGTTITSDLELKRGTRRCSPLGGASEWVSGATGTHENPVLGVFWGIQGVVFAPFWGGGCALRSCASLRVLTHYCALYNAHIVHSCASCAALKRTRVHHAHFILAILNARIHRDTSSRAVHFVRILVHFTDVGSNALECAGMRQDVASSKLRQNQAGSLMHWRRCIFTPPRTSDCVDLMQMRTRSRMQPNAQYM